MTREELIKKINKRIDLNNDIMMNGGCCAHCGTLMNNNTSLQLIKTELQKQNDKSYEQGMRDIWNLMQKIYCEPGFNKYNKREEIFGWEYMSDILERLSPEVALEKLRDYEERKRVEAEKPVVGDVVEFDASCGPKTGVLLYENSTCYWVLEAAGECPQRLSKENFKIKKTGKHVDIQGMLDEIKE